MWRPFSIPFETRPPDAGLKAQGFSPIPSPVRRPFRAAPPRLATPCAGPSGPRLPASLPHARNTCVTNARQRRLPFQVERAITDSSTQSRMTLPAVLSAAFVVPMAKRPRSTSRAYRRSSRYAPNRTGRQPVLFSFPRPARSCPSPRRRASWPPALSRPAASLLCPSHRAARPLPRRSGFPIASAEAMGRMEEGPPPYPSRAHPIKLSATTIRINGDETRMATFLHSSCKER